MSNTRLRSDDAASHPSPTLPGAVLSKIHTRACRVARMRELWRDPKYRAKQMARIAKRFADPAMRAWIAEVGRQHALKNPQRLPPMTEEQRLYYKKCQRNGIPREQALAAVFGTKP